MKEETRAFLRMELSLGKMGGCLVLPPPSDGLIKGRWRGGSGFAVILL